MLKINFQKNTRFIEKCVWVLLTESPWWTFQCYQELTLMGNCLFSSGFYLNFTTFPLVSFVWELIQSIKLFLLLLSPQSFKSLSFVFNLCVAAHAEICCYVGPRNQIRVIRPEWLGSERLLYLLFHLASSVFLSFCLFLTECVCLCLWEQEQIVSASIYLPGQHHPIMVVSN